MADEPRRTATRRAVLSYDRLKRLTKESGFQWPDLLIKDYQGILQDTTFLADETDKVEADLVIGIEDLEIRVGVNEADIIILYDRVGVNEADISTLDGRVSTNESNITTLDGRVSTNEDDILEIQNAQFLNLASQLQDMQRQLNGLPELTIDTTGFTTDLTTITTDKVIA